MFCSQMRGFSLLWLLIYEKKRSLALCVVLMQTRPGHFFHMHSQSQGIQLMCHRLTIFIAQFGELQYDGAVFFIYSFIIFLRGGPLPQDSGLTAITAPNVPISAPPRED